MSSTADASIDEFLDLACLTYQGNDDPDRRARAKGLLSDHPTWPNHSLTVAAALGDRAAVDAHLTKNPEQAILPSGPRDWVPLLYACYSRVQALAADPAGVVQALLNAGADPNCGFVLWGSPFTALTGAMGEGELGVERQPPHPEALRLAQRLLDAGADPNDSQGLYNTMHRPDDSWLQFLLERGLDRTHRIGWDMKTAEGPRTLDFLLAHAVDNGFEQRIERLLAHGADPDSTNPYNARPLHTNALLAGHREIAARLVAAGAEPVPLSPAQRFRLACIEGDEAEARRLLATDGKLLEDWSLLWTAAQKGLLDTARLLLDLGVDVHSADPGGATALHKAAENGHLELVELLLARGADPARRDHRFGATAKGWAEHSGQDRTAGILP